VVRVLTVSDQALVRLKVVCGLGDRGEPVLTIMLSDEGASCHDAG